MSKLKELFETKAFILALLGTAAAIGGVYGFNVPVAQIMAILTPIMIAIGAAGWSDAVKMKAKMALEHDVRMQALANGHMTYAEVANGNLPSERMKQAGFINATLMLALTALAGLALLLSSCGTDCKDPKNAGNLQCVVKNAVVDCTGVDSLSSAIAVITPIIENGVKVATNPDGSINWTSVENLGLQLAWKYGLCAVAQVWNNLFGGPASTNTGMKLVAGRWPQAKASFDRIRQQVAPGYTVKLTGGAL